MARASLKDTLKWTILVVVTIPAIVSARRFIMGTHWLNDLRLLGTDETMETTSQHMNVKMSNGKFINKFETIEKKFSKRIANIFGNIFAFNIYIAFRRYFEKHVLQEKF